jgi:flagellar biosynthesis component FlhA
MRLALLIRSVTDHGRPANAGDPEDGFQGKDMGFAFGIVVILSILFLPIPAFLIDVGLAFSIAFSVLILMVALWIKRPLDFSPSRPSC